MTEKATYLENQEKTAVAGDPRRKHSSPDIALRDWGVKGKRALLDREATYGSSRRAACESMSSTIASDHHEQPV
jgi:hypothetical protein